ncbi:MAG: Niacin transporter NiaP [uncultured Sphingomonadaceae bacterium]|uniref:Niacin transporter NiaP n=1 Tax=uncultured Sphingomonadaceae bacterium TaxID=169976 RepID=A0A6J4TIY1_9SPHN|nr:MAG: Niacin transporter NiaP [uncultured Sphingomonadaceae bacterium]
MQATSARRYSIIGERAPLFWSGCGAIAAGVLLHLPMLAMAHDMGGHVVGMPMDPWMYLGMGLILIGVPLACYGALPAQRAQHSNQAGTQYEAPDEMPLNRWHAAVLVVLTLGLIIDTMKPATLGFVLPGMRAEYRIPSSTVALLPFVALLGTTVGSFVWGFLADIYGRRVSILLSTILFVSTSICGAMPQFEWNLLMCFLMGSSAGGMLPVVYTLLAEGMPPKHRSWVLVLVGGTGLVGGYLAASGAAWLFEPEYGWRSLWLQGFPTGLLLLALARWIPESPRFLAEEGRHAELQDMERKYGIVRREREPVPADAAVAAQRHGRLTAALTIAALAWSLVNFGLVLWLPSDLQQRGYSAELASGIIASSALIALPTIMLAAWAYSRWSSKWTLVGTALITLAGLAGALLPPAILSLPVILITVVALLIVGTNGMIAVLLPYAAENYPLGVRGRATGLIAGSSKFGGVTVQGFALLGFIPTLGGAALALLAPMGISALLIGYAGRETRGRSLRELESAGGA